jgi:hypothetical protein
MVHIIFIITDFISQKNFLLLYKFFCLKFGGNFHEGSLYNRVCNFFNYKEILIQYL